VKDFIAEGRVGVSLFMVLSGFILTKISYGKDIDYKGFVFNRFIRIYPLYVLVMVIVAFTSPMKVGIVQFLGLMSPFGNLADLSTQKFSQVWTIPVEFQFYLIFPFLVAFLSRYGLKYLFGFVLLSVGVRFLMFDTDGTVRETAYWTIVGRIDDFVIGMAAAVIAMKRPKLLSSIPALVITSLCVYGWVVWFSRATGGFYGPNSHENALWAIYPTIEATVFALFVVSYLNQRWNGLRVVDKAFSYLGEVSYSMYIWHLPLLLMFNKHSEFLPFSHWFTNFAIVVFPVIVVVSSLSYYMIERPFFIMRKVYVKSTRYPLGVGEKIPV
jgi:peptidoglycan/LPS O-acetylase OafA/YrhL